MIYHILARSAALVARVRGEYRAASLATEGFMHCSQLQQVVGVANAFYAGQRGLALLVIDPARLQAAPRHFCVLGPPPRGQDIRTNLSQIRYKNCTDTCLAAKPSDWDSSTGQAGGDHLGSSIHIEYIVLRQQ